MCHLKYNVYTFQLRQQYLRCILRFNVCNIFFWIWIRRANPSFSGNPLWTMLVLDGTGSCVLCQHAMWWSWREIWYGTPIRPWVLHSITGSLESRAAGLKRSAGASGPEPCLLHPTDWQPATTSQCARKYGYEGCSKLDSVWGLLMSIRTTTPSSVSVWVVLKLSCLQTGTVSNIEW